MRFHVHTVFSFVLSLFSTFKRLKTMENATSDVVDDVSFKKLFFFDLVGGTAGTQI